MYKNSVSIKDVRAARDFVSVMGKYPGIRIMLNADEYSIDAHSIIGILSLDLSQPIELVAEGEISEEFINDLQPYII